MTERLPDSDDGPAEIWLSPSCGPREWCNTPEWGETCPDCGKPSVRYVRADLIAQARAAERERCAKVAEEHEAWNAVSEDAPYDDHTRAKLNKAVACRGIAADIRALSDETPSAGDR